MLLCALQVGEVQAVLQNTTHNGFPVCADTSVGEIFTGLITRTHLLAVLQHIANQHSGNPSSSSSSSTRPTTNGGLSNRLLPRQLSWHELNRKMFDPVDVEGRVSRPGEQQMVPLSPTFSGELDFLAVPGVQGELVDLTPYINTSAVAVSGQGGCAGDRVWGKTRLYGAGAGQLQVSREVSGQGGFHRNGGGWANRQGRGRVGWGGVEEPAAGRVNTLGGMLVQVWALPGGSAFVVAAAADRAHECPASCSMALAQLGMCPSPILLGMFPHTASAWAGTHSRLCMRQVSPS
jgi:hypothetical protein